MFGNRRRRDSIDFLFEILAALSIAVIGILMSLLFYLWTSTKNAIRLPRKLEPTEPKVTPSLGGYLIGVALIIGVLSSFSLSAVGLIGIAEHSIVLSLASFTGVLITGYFTLRASQLHNSPIRIAPQVEALKLSDARAYTISLPHSTGWEPELAHRFMEQILDKVYGRLTFRIVAEKGRIRWQIVDLRAGIEPSAIRQAVAASYPDAEVKVNSFALEPFTTAFYRLVLHYKQAADFIGPIRYVTDLKRLDPLAAITQEMTNLQAGERIIYTLFISGSANFARREGQKLTTTSAILPWEFLH